MDIDYISLLMYTNVVYKGLNIDRIINLDSLTFLDDAGSSFRLQMGACYIVLWRVALMQGRNDSGVAIDFLRLWRFLAQGPKPKMGWVYPNLLVPQFPRSTIRVVDSALSDKAKYLPYESPRFFLEVVTYWDRPWRCDQMPWVCHRYAAKIPLPSSFTKLAVPVQRAEGQRTRRLVDVPPLWHSNTRMHVVVCGDHCDPLTSYSDNYRGVLAI